MRRLILKNFFSLTDTHLLFAKIQVESLKSQAKIDFFQIKYNIFGLKTVENISILSFIVKTKNVTKYNS